MSDALDAHVKHQQTQPDRKKTFQPPESALIDQFARTICHALAELDGESTLDPEVVSGFSSFIKLIAKVKSKELNGEIGF